MEGALVGGSTGSLRPVSPELVWGDLEALGGDIRLVVTECYIFLMIKYVGKIEGE